MHTSKNTDLHLYSTSRPVIEHSSALRFAPYPTSLSQPMIHSESQHYAVQDFDWIKPTPSPNWNKLADVESDAFNKAVAGAAFDDTLEKPPAL
ncbi:hypothetical protein BS47DRAFT_729188 [Hydnum rufescens UP504]|uniref:C-CAP/cofactor C-like domain-containing protein n=1 Tax=Hydnum rufescens UP504 TaxID=1448309 RepID=A0A9P6DZE8_9AGAM|nr:hypothetical protein BS47DRAFT_729188 [Hydnum rufescens UP504]